MIHEAALHTRVGSPEIMRKPRASTRLAEVIVQHGRRGLVRGGRHIRAAPHPPP
ncbi:hypothetical protein [Streptomyces antibioticus]|uniref:hypothetical protein n=1 Tax=Streptomyces antibioticus TaxID=1890 RepID=UPI003700C958